MILLAALVGVFCLILLGGLWALAYRGRKRWSAERGGRTVSDGIQIIRASAGDVAVVTHPSALTQEMREWVIKAVERQLPQGVSVVLLDSGLRMSHVVSGADNTTRMPLRSQ